MKGGGRMEQMTPQERTDTRMAMLYELRLLFTKEDSKEQYTREEILAKLDEIAIANK